MNKVQMIYWRIIPVQRCISFKNRQSQSIPLRIDNEEVQKPNRSCEQNPWHYCPLKGSDQGMQHSFESSDVDSLQHFCSIGRGISL